MKSSEMLITRKLWSLEGILEDELKCEVYKDEFYTLENGKVISRFWVEKHGVSIYNKNTWRENFRIFCRKKMTAFEMVYYEYEVYKRCVKNQVKSKRAK